MFIPQRCQYALRAVFELAKRYQQGPTAIRDIAEVQAIPPRFLETILNQLKQAGFVGSHRGRRGGYFLKRSPADLTVGDIVRFMEGPIGPVACVHTDPGDTACPLRSRCVFLPIWDEVSRRTLDVYDRHTFQRLVEMDAEQSARESYCI